MNLILEWIEQHISILISIFILIVAIKQLRNNTKAINGSTISNYSEKEREFYSKFNSGQVKKINSADIESFLNFYEDLSFLINKKFIKMRYAKELWKNNIVIVYEKYKEEISKKKMNNIIVLYKRWTMQNDKNNNYIIQIYKNMKWEDWRDAICYFFKNSLIGAAGGIIVIAMTETKSISTVLIVAFILAAIYLLVYPTIKNLENTP